jgi:hypothetical protein
MSATPNPYTGSAQSGANSEGPNRVNGGHHLRREPSGPMTSGPYVSRSSETEVTEKLSHGEPTWFVRKIFVTDAYRQVAPKRLLARLDERV